MLTRLKVNGFKNLVDVDVSFGPFTCIAGANDVGKSNLFDAISFLGALADRPLLEAAQTLRSEADGFVDVQSLFHQAGSRTVQEMTFEAEMLIPWAGTDELGQEAEADATLLRYRLTLGADGGGLAVRREELEALSPKEADRLLAFPHSASWRRSAVLERARQVRFISTTTMAGTVQVRLRQTRGRPLLHQAGKLTATSLSSATAAVNPTAALTRREMRSWRVLQLEPSALRSPDAFGAPARIAANGAHLPATLARLAGLVPPGDREASELHRLEARREALYAEIANRLGGLVEGLREVRVDLDERRGSLALKVVDRDGTERDARSLSDGTLRFLALAILACDSEAGGVLCVEEPENGIHPERVSALLSLLQELAADPGEAVSGDNPLRQVLINTHSPVVAAQVPEDSLLVAIPQSLHREGQRFMAPGFYGLPGSWRTLARGIPSIPLGVVLSYLQPADSRTHDERPRRVIDREDVQAWLPTTVVSEP